MKKRLILLVTGFLVVGLTFGMSYWYRVSATAPGVNQLISQDASGTYANDGTSTGYYGTGPYISSNGRYVAFDSNASNLVSGDTNGNMDVFVKDTTTGTVTRASIDYAENQINDRSVGNGMTPDGRYVLFAIGNSHQLMVRNMINNTTTAVCTGACQGVNERGGAISADGRFVTFTNQDYPGHYYQAVIKNMATGTFKALSTNSSGVEGNGDSAPGGISCDGGVASFSTMATNLPGSSSGTYLATFDINGNVQLTRVPLQENTAVSCDGNEIASWSPSGSVAGEYNRLTGTTL